MTSSTSSVPLFPRLAPVRHTLILSAMFVVLAIAGASLRHEALTSTAEHTTRLPLYLSLLAAEWGLVYFVWKGALEPRCVTLREFVGGHWAHPLDVVRDVLLAATVWGIWTGANLAWVRWFPQLAGSSVGTMLPGNPAEIAAWIALSLSAGFAEEIVFRGYLQRQFRAITGSLAAALALQAVLFGVSHGYQGFWPCLRITGFGLLFGCLAEWRKSLRPGMIAHAWTDIFAGLSR